MRAAGPDAVNGDRHIVVCTMSYQHIFQRPNLARTAAQLLQAGGRVLWVVIEDTHSLRKMASSPEHYEWIIASNRAFVTTLGVDVVCVDRFPSTLAFLHHPPVSMVFQLGLPQTHTYACALPEHDTPASLFLAWTTTAVASLSYCRDRSRMLGHP